MEGTNGRGDFAVCMIFDNDNMTSGSGSGSGVGWHASNWRDEF